MNMVTKRKITVEIPLLVTSCSSSSSSPSSMSISMPPTPVFTPTPSSKNSGKRSHFPLFCFKLYFYTTKKFIAFTVVLLLSFSMFQFQNIHEDATINSNDLLSLPPSSSSSSSSIGDWLSQRVSSSSNANSNANTIAVAVVSTEASDTTGGKKHEGQKRQQGVTMPESEFTGSWANCTKIDSDLQRKHRQLSKGQDQHHSDEMQSTTVSCHDIQYRIHKESFRRDSGNDSGNEETEIIIGVLSGAGGAGPGRRMAIRETWANANADYTLSKNYFDTVHHTLKNDISGSGDSKNDHDKNENKIKNGKIRIFFLVAGPFENIRTEYDTYGDIIWINEEEIYAGEQSVLTYKTQSFIRIIHNVVTKLALRHVKYLFKTDDDSYVHVNNLYLELMDHQKDDRDFWGWCQKKKFAPKRDASVKWPVSYELYPEPMYPPYCQGAGFALSRKFMDCAANAQYGNGDGDGANSNSNNNENGDHDQSPIANLRFMPFEDVSMGMIAERCNVKPVMIEKQRWINLYRTGMDEEKKRVREGMPKIEKSLLTRPVMLNRIVQHRIYDEWDMKEHHKVVVDPVRYNKESRVNWYSPTSPQTGKK